MSFDYNREQLIEELAATKEALREALKSSPSNLAALQLKAVTDERDKYKTAHEQLLRHNSKLHDEVAVLAAPAEADEARLREARAETWDEAVAVIHAWWAAAPEDRPAMIVNPYGAGLGGGEQ